jgi:Acyl-CoA dehydrogenase, C-terminal domain
MLVSGICGSDYFKLTDLLATAMGHLGRGLAIVRAYAAVRTFPSQPGVTLSSLPLFAKTTATVTKQYRSNMLLTFLVAALLGISEHPSPSEALVDGTSPVPPSVGSRSPARLSGLVPSSPTAVLALLRILTPIAKARTAKTGVAGLQECMEALGGVGYCENEENQEINVARLYRDANVLAIWEGTTDVMATDLVKVITGRDGKRVLGALDAWIGIAVRGRAMADEKRLVTERWQSLRAELQGKQREELLADGRTVMEQLGDVVCAVLLIADAERDGDETASECSRLFAREKFGRDAKENWADANRWDARIAFGIAGRPKERL